MTDNASVMNVDGASVSEALLAANETRDIVLPNQNEHVAHIAIDVKKIIAVHDLQRIDTCNRLAAL
jgi:hypothetical protein